ncbi:MAG: methionine adenosyltransferase [Candidatus Methanosuratincola sp.]|jgi:S-adenosylmethionine synthetase
MGRNVFIGYLSGKPPYEEEVEIVERKGLGHPDTICDNLAEQVSIALSRYYLEEFGVVMHHNVDKGLLVGGVAVPCYGGGEVVEPIEITVVGRAVREKDGRHLPVDEIAIHAIRKWLKGNVRHLDIERHVATNVKIRPGSRDLVELFERFGRGEVPLSNDTAVGAGFYPLDELEKTVLNTERLLNSVEVKGKYPFIGEDIKVIGIRNRGRITLTVAMAIVDRFVSGLRDYIQKVSEVRELLQKEIASSIGAEIHINTADSYERESIYLTVTGTSAEGGDDGQVGRGNRVNGLITAYRPMSMEAAAGKNPISHVGKIYNLFSQDLSRAIVEGGYAGEAYVYIASQIGKPINEPQILDIKVRGKDVDFASIGRLTEEALSEMPKMWKRVIEGECSIA